MIPIQNAITMTMRMAKGMGATTAKVTARDMEAQATPEVSQAVKLPQRSDFCRRKEI